MSNRFRLAAPALAAVLVLGACESATRPTGVAGSAGSGDDTPCVGVVTGTHDNVVVPPEALCILVNAVVRGNVKALQGSVLAGFNNTVRGNVEGDKADAVQWNGGSVGGSIHIIGFEQADPFFVQAISNTTVLPGGNIQVEKLNAGGIQIINNTLQKGNIKVEDNFLQFPMIISANNVAQNIQVFKNRGPAPKSVTGNTAGESIQCKENTPPFLGGPNVAPKKEDQCF